MALSIVGLCIFIYSQMIPYEYQDLQQAIQKKDSEQIIKVTNQVVLTPEQRKESLYTLYQIGESQGSCQLLNRSVMKDESLWQETIVSAPIDVLKCLAKKNILYQTDSEGNNPLHLTASFNVDQERWRYLLSESTKPSINQCNAIGESPLTSAARMGNIDAVKSLLNQGATIKKCNVSAMQVAIEQNNRVMFDLLSEKGGSISKQEIKKIVGRTGATLFEDSY